MMHFIPVLQTLIVFVLTYVSKLLKDVRTELNTVSKRIERLDVLYVELEKRHAQKNEDTEKRFVESIHEIKTEQLNLRSRIEKIMDRLFYGRITTDENTGEKTR